METTTQTQDINAYVRLPHQRAVKIWLMACLVLIVLMVALGGYTRLSGSGLSITEWAPVHGVVPPLNEAEWQEEFDAYRASPQYVKINQGMTLEEFKNIYWPEYLHRLLGRAIGLVFFVPLVFFACKRAITRRFGLRLAAIFALGGAQGGLGWVMVKSGLVDQPYVSQIKLAAHLGLALVIFGLLLWALLDVVEKKKKGDCLGWLTLGALFVQIIFGAFLAGLHGGLIYNTYPTMNGEWLPTGILSQAPWWVNIYENIITIQFIHRWLAIGVALAYFVWWAKSRANERVQLAVGLVVLQVGLGIATLVAQVPLALALLHQLNALALIAATLFALHSKEPSCRLS